ncbi:MAG TPA: ABC transporter permease [Candidatus Acidoferrales bacterium]|nr:ABC transporter permease [Candidatus Acidoferrales bacterium]
MNSIWQDLHYGVRTLAKSPGFTAITILTLALGIGANTAIFSVVNTALLRPLPYQNPGRLVNIFARSKMFDFPNLGLSAPDIEDIRRQNTVFSQVTTFGFTTKVLTGQGAPQQLAGIRASVDYIPMLGVQPLYGRTFQPGEMQAGQDREIILSSKTWKEQFGSDPRAVGKTITLDKVAYTIIGVMPPQFQFPYNLSYAVPNVISKSDLAARGSHGIPVLARLKPGRTVDQAQAELDAIAAQLAKAYPDADKGWSFRAVSMKANQIGKANVPLLILLGAVSFVLLIGCANVGNLFLSRGWGRRRELAIRATLGATRGRVVRQLLVESMILAIVGGACGLLLALWGIDSLRALLPPGTPRLEDLKVDRWVLWFTLGVSLLAGILFGLVPALLVSRQELSAAMKEGGAGAQTGASGPRHNPLRQLLVVSEFALALVLVIGATLALRSLARLLDVNLGFRTDHVLTLRLDFPSYKFAKPEQAISFAQQVIGQARTLPGVDDVAGTLFAPLSGGSGESTFEVEGAPKLPLDQLPRADVTWTTPGYFHTLGIPLIAGRDFTESDVLGSAPVYIVNQTLARKIFGDASPIGKRLSQGKDKFKKTIWAEVVGEVGDIRDRSPDAPPEPELYVPYYADTQFVTGGVSLMFRTKTKPQSLATAVKQRVWSLDKDQPIADVKTMDEWVADSDAAPRSQTYLLGGFASLGLLLALIGIYGVISYSVSQRTREIGIRMALGAEPKQVLRIVLQQGLMLALAGVAIGLVASLALTRLMSTLLFEISATDPLTFIGVAILLTLVALAACYVPARRAMRVDPMVALRYE